MSGEGWERRCQRGTCKPPTGHPWFSLRQLSNSRCLDCSRTPTMWRSWCGIMWELLRAVRSIREVTPAFLRLMAVLLQTGTATIQNSRQRQKYPSQQAGQGHAPRPPPTLLCMKTPQRLQVHSASGRQHARSTSHMRTSVVDSRLFARARISIPTRMKGYFEDSSGEKGLHKVVNCWGDGRCWASTCLRSAPVSWVVKAISHSNITTTDKSEILRIIDWYQIHHSIGYPAS